MVRHLSSSCSLPRRLSLVASLGTQKDLSIAVVVVADSIPGCQNVAGCITAVLSGTS